MSFYAVANGHSIGIFETWDECSKYVKGYKGAAFKKFSTKESAEEFIESFRTETINQVVPSTTILIPDYYVYTDGACSNNGKPNAVAGIGIFFGIDDPRNVSQKLMSESIMRQTNNVAELMAIIDTFRIIDTDLLSGKKVAIVTDSEYAMKCSDKYGEKCANTGWTKEIPNKVLVKILYELCVKWRKSVQIIHVKAHTNEKDPHSIGNHYADKLANLAIGLNECPYNKIQFIAK
jgi:ribonuclease HI